jgi:hypothetical protein
VILASASNQGFSMPAPAPGIHHFSIARTGAQFQFRFDGNLVASFSDTFGLPADHVGFFFVGPFPGQLGAFHIDRVQVVPAPGWLCAVGMALIATKRNRRIGS